MNTGREKLRRWGVGGCGVLGELRFPALLTESIKILSTVMGNVGEIGLGKD